MRLPLILLASACLFTSCQQGGAIEAGCKTAVENMFMALGQPHPNVRDFKVNKRSDAAQPKTTTSMPDSILAVAGTYQLNGADDSFDLLCVTSDGHFAVRSTNGM